MRNCLLCGQFLPKVRATVCLRCVPTPQCASLLFSAAHPAEAAGKPCPDCGRRIVSVMMGIIVNGTPQFFHEGEWRAQAKGVDLEWDKQFEFLDKLPPPFIPGMHTLDRTT